MTIATRLRLLECYVWSTLTGQIEGNRAQGRQRWTFLSWLKRSTDIKPLYIIAKMQRRQENDVVAAVNARTLARHLDLYIYSFAFQYYICRSRILQSCVFNPGNLVPYFSVMSVGLWSVWFLIFRSCIFSRPARDICQLCCFWCSVFRELKNDCCFLLIKVVVRAQQINEKKTEIANAQIEMYWFNA